MRDWVRLTGQLPGELYQASVGSNKQTPAAHALYTCSVFDVAKACKDLLYLPLLLHASRAVCTQLLSAWSSCACVIVINVK